MPPLRLLLVAPGPPPVGGITRWTSLLVGWLGGQPDITFRQVDTSPRWRGIAESGIGRRLLGGSLQGLRDAWKVLIQIVRFRPDVIHLTTSGSLAGIRDIAVLCLGRLARVPTIYHIRFGRIPDLVQRGGWEWRLLYCSLKLARKVIAIDPMTYRALVGLLPTEKLLVLPNGVPVERRSGKELNGAGQTRTILFLGWVIPTKGASELVHAWKRVRESGWDLLIAGPSENGYRQELVGALGADARVRFHGEVSHSEGERLMRQADIFVLPSHTEGFPNVILEAMAAGKAIVATCVGAIPEMLDADAPKPCGILVEPKDPQALAAALSRLMADAGLRSELGARARTRVEHNYDARDVFSRLAQIWKGAAKCDRGSTHD